MSTIELRNVYKDYDTDIRAVSDFSLKIDDGEFVVLVGPSGCGKSTTLRMMAGLEDITAGEVLIDDVIVNNDHPKDRDIAMVFQNYALYPHMTVEENMGFGLKMKEVPKDEIEGRVIETAKIIGLEDFLDRLPKELSGGQSQRVALGRAVIRNPKVFLMDEPLSNLDAKLRARTRYELTQLSRELGVTTVYVTHDQVEAMTMADRIVIMDEGRIQQVGTPREVYLRPANEFVANFIGSPPMNLFEVEVTPEGFKSGDTILEAPSSIIKNLINKGYENKIVTFGIRPENIVRYEHASEAIREYSMKRVIDYPEMLGSETHLHFQLFGKDVIAKDYTFDIFEPGQEETFCIDYNFVHFFESDTELRIEHPGINGAQTEIPTI